MKKANYKEILLKDISPDPNQPRKFYDEHATKELTESIKESGVLQPIVVRELPGKSNKYLIVCGERRYKASLSAKVKTIPAVIRELSDEEALQMQIVENLQRKDVHPMEEAIAFKSLHEKMTIVEIASRVGKSEKFVARRLKLNDLIEDAQLILYGNHMDLAQAFELAKLEPNIQSEIINQRAPKNWKKNNSDWIIGSISYLINQVNNDLKEAIFKLGDAKLYPDAGACTKCPYNSANQPLLFDDKNKICTKPSCYALKTEMARKLKFEEIASNPDVICISPDSYLTTEEKVELKLAEECGIKILDRKKYEVVYSVTSEPPLSYEAWLEDDREEYEVEGWEAPEGDKDALPPIDEDRAKEDYESYKKSETEDYEQYQKDLADGKYVEAYVVCGNAAGKTRTIRLKSNAVVSEVSSEDDSDVQGEIEKIKEREKRNKELDAEKIWSKVRALVPNSELQPCKLLNTLEVECFVQALKQKMNYGNNRKWLSWLDEAEGQDANLVIARVARAFILDVLPIAFGSHETSESNRLAYGYIKGLLPKEVDTIELEQQEVAIARAERVSKRISALQNKLNK